MKLIYKILLPMALMGTSQISFATGMMSCNSGDKATWKTQDELRTTVIEKGWEVRRVKVDGGCYELYGTNPDGKRVEAYFDPLTLEMLLVSQRGKILYKKELK